MLKIIEICIIKEFYILFWALLDFENKRKASKIKGSKILASKSSPCLTSLFLASNCLNAQIGQKDRKIRTFDILFCALLDLENERQNLLK